jgi:hypothetical protein
MVDEMRRSWKNGEKCNFYVLVRCKKKKKIVIVIVILVPVKFANFDFGPHKITKFWFWSLVIFVFSQKNADMSHEFNMASAMSLNSSYIIIFLRQIKWGTKISEFKFYRGKLDEFFLQGPKPKLKNFIGTKSTIYPL